MRTFERSKQLLDDALKVIPVGSQTFSKSHYCFPVGGTPLFIEHAKGPLVWDYDGNEYIDFISALLAINMGYADEEINNAVINQIHSGSIFSLPNKIETEVAELIIDAIPCAEKVRFGKNGSDATSAAIRLARAYTGKEEIAVCGYHGWHDWYIGSTTRSLGVPKSVQALTHKFEYNDISTLEKIFDNTESIAAVILEPMNVFYPKNGFLEGVRDLCDRHGAVLIFDETITGFRFDPGSAQALFGVTPDLTALGKGLANGFPLSAICGKHEIMDLMDSIFFSGTYAGDATALAAAKASLTKANRVNATAHIKHTGEYLISGLRAIIKNHNLEEIFTVNGHPSWSFLLISHEKTPYSEELITTYLMQEMAQNGILFFGSHNLNYAHTEKEVDKLLASYNSILPSLKSAIDNANLEQLITCEPVKPIFHVRKK